MYSSAKAIPPRLKNLRFIIMSKYNFKVKIVFLNLPVYETVVSAINGYQAKQTALSNHRVETGCGLNELYNNEKTTAQQINWLPV